MVGGVRVGVGLMRVQEPHSESPDSVIPFPNNGDPLDKTGQAACDLVHQAAAVAEQKAQQIMGVAHKLSLQLRSAEDQIIKLQGDVKHYKERADRAEKWLHRIALEIQHKFFASPQINAQQSEAENYAAKRQRSS
jgi:hypothetical protein